MAQNPRIPKIVWAITCIVFVGVAAIAFYSLKRVSPQGAAPLEKYGTVPDFTLTDQTGQKVSLQDLKGKVWVSDFIFTQCMGPCPLITSRMAEVNQQLDYKGDGVRLISFSVDPEHDTPQILAEYGKSAGANPQRWKFLTGSKEDIQRVVEKGLLQSLVKSPDGSPAHSTRFVVVDQNGIMRSFRDGSDPEVVQKTPFGYWSLASFPGRCKFRKRHTTVEIR